MNGFEQSFSIVTNLLRPVKELKGFKKVELEPEESKTFELQLREKKCSL